MSEVIHCPICGTPFPESEGYYTVGLHTYVCSKPCQLKAYDQELKTETTCPLEQLNLDLD